MLKYLGFFIQKKIGFILRNIRFKIGSTNKKMIESAILMKRYPIRNNNPDLYYVYYGTLALYQHQGSIWEQWNKSLKASQDSLFHKFMDTIEPVKKDVKVHGIE